MIQELSTVQHIMVLVKLIAKQFLWMSLVSMHWKNFNYSATQIGTFHWWHITWCTFVLILFFQYDFYFLSWFTDPPKIVKFKTEYFVDVQQSVTPNCQAEGNPPPTYTWIPCDSEQGCDKNTLHISQVLNNANYTCKVANLLGNDERTASVCKFHYSLAYSHYTPVSSCMYQVELDILIGFSELNQGSVSLSGCKSPNSAFTLSWWITLSFL